MENLLTKKTIINSANVDQISFIIDLVHGYDESKLTDIETIKDESFFYNSFLTKAEKVFSDIKKNPKKVIKSFFPPNIRDYLPKYHQCVLLNAMQLYNYKNKIIRLFENKDIRPSMYAHNAESDGVEESEQKLGKSIGERVK